MNIVEPFRVCMHALLLVLLFRGYDSRVYGRTVTMMGLLSAYSIANSLHKTYGQYIFRIKDHRRDVTVLACNTFRKCVVERHILTTIDKDTTM